MSKLKDAIAGGTVYITQAELTAMAQDTFEQGGIITVADLAAWCITFGLQYDYNEETETFKIFS